MRRTPFGDREGGFTLIEIILVVVLIGILLTIAVPSFVKARHAARARSCVANLKQIQTAKDQWAMEYKKPDSATPADMSVLTIEDPAGQKGAYLKTEVICPCGGKYKINAISTYPSCSFVDPTYPHSLTTGSGG